MHRCELYYLTFSLLPSAVLPPSLTPARKPRASKTSCFGPSLSTATAEPAVRAEQSGRRHCHRQEAIPLLLADSKSGKQGEGVQLV